jgi:hypothetical protein
MRLAGAMLEFSPLRETQLELNLTSSCLHQTALTIRKNLVCSLVSAFDLSAACERPRVRAACELVQATSVLAWSRRSIVVHSTTPGTCVSTLTFRGHAALVCRGSGDGQQLRSRAGQPRRGAGRRCLYARVAGLA